MKNLNQLDEWLSHRTTMKLGEIIRYLTSYRTDSSYDEVLISLQDNVMSSTLPENAEFHYIDVIDQVDDTNYIEELIDRYMDPEMELDESVGINIISKSFMAGYDARGSQVDLLIKLLMQSIYEICSNCAYNQTDRCESTECWINLALDDLDF